MESIEQAFDETEAIADTAFQAATDLVKLVRQLKKHAREGNIASIRRTQDKIEGQREDLSRALDEAARSWPLEAEEEQRYFDDGYTDELRRAAVELGLRVYERDGRLIVHPSIVHVLARDRAVRVDRKKVSAVRPSHLAVILQGAQNKKSPFRPEQFLESLYGVYLELVKDETTGRLVKSEHGRVVPLARIYKLLTSLPGIKRDYSPTDFARDLFFLDSRGVTKTRSGATVSFPSSTGTRGTKGLFTFVGPDGQDVRYYGIRFMESG